MQIINYKKIQKIEHEIVLPNAMEAWCAGWMEAEKENKEADLGATPFSCFEDATDSDVIAFDDYLASQSFSNSQILRLCKLLDGTVSLRHDISVAIFRRCLYPQVSMLDHTANRLFVKALSGLAKTYQELLFVHVFVPVALAPTFNTHHRDCILKAVKESGNCERLLEVLVEKLVQNEYTNHYSEDIFALLQALLLVTASIPDVVLPDMVEFLLAQANLIPNSLKLSTFVVHFLKKNPSKLVPYKTKFESMVDILKKLRGPLKRTISGMIQKT
eukprot:m.63996 g.63996  ORF g.63996 m.63996 type:complete len:273 (-) comp11618_c0_seq2:2615-3433(-)